jgi:endonuclease YncB( thermonuclease family)
MLLLAVLGAVLSSLLFSPVASAKRIPCVLGQKGGPKCLMWEAKVHLGDDGDTVKAAIKKGNRYGNPVLVRFTGIQAMELFNYSRKSRKGACMGVPATVALEKMVRNSHVRLLAQKASSKSIGDTRARLRRSFQVQQGGRWIDPAAELLKRGLVLPFPNGQEWAWNGLYARLAQEAARRGKGIWNPTSCGKAGPAQANPLRMKVKWDAPNVDKASGEWIRIHNDGTTPVSLKGWTVRDAHLRGDKHKPGYKFPSNAVIPPNDAIRVVVGKGQNTATTFYWGLPEKETIFENASNDKKKAGDGAYLFDPDGELRAHTMYPCRVACSQPYAGELAVTARYQGVEHEWVTITNRSSNPVSLYEYELESSPWFYEFDKSDVLLPGRSIVVWINKPHPVPASNGGRSLLPPVPGLIPFQTVQRGGFRSWNHTDALLSDNKDVVALRNPLGIPVPGACDAWGGERCPGI